MPRIKTYLRVARSTRGRKHRVQASANPNFAPLTDSSGNNWLPTVAFAIMLDIPDSAFDQASQVIAEITIPEDQIRIAAEVTQ